MAESFGISSCNLSYRQEVLQTMSWSAVRDQPPSPISTPNARAAVNMSLSPRPHMFMQMM